MLGLQALGAIGAGVQQGAAQWREFEKEKRAKEQAEMQKEMFGLQKEQFGWQREQQDQLRKERDQTNAAAKRYQDTIKAIDTDGDGVADAFISDYNKQQDGLKDGMYARLIRDPKSNKVTHINYSSRSEDGNQIGNTVEFSPELLRAAARTRYMAELGAISPEKFQQMTALQLQLDQFDRQGKQFDLSYQQADRIARERNQTTRDVYAGNNATAIEVAKIKSDGGSGAGKIGAKEYVRLFGDLVKANMERDMTPSAAATMARLQMAQSGLFAPAGVDDTAIEKGIVAKRSQPEETPKKGLPTTEERKTKPLPENWKPTTPYERAQATRPDGGKRLAERDAAGIAALRKRLAEVKTVEDAVAVQDDSYFSALSREEKQSIFNKVMGR